MIRAFSYILTNKNKVTHQWKKKAETKGINIS